MELNYELAQGHPMCVNCRANCTKELVWAKQGWNSDGQAWDTTLCVSCTGL